MEFEYRNFTLWTTTLILSSTIFIILSYRRRWKSTSNNCHHRLPPGPPGWPLFGNIFDLGSMPHRTLAGLKQQYGPVVWLKLGSVKTMVILNANSAAEFFKNHDLSFADRTVADTLRSHDYCKGSLALAPYGTYWRVMRRIMTVEILVTRRINDTAAVRERCVNEMLLWIHKEAEAEAEAARGIHVAEFVFLGLVNILGNLILSRDLVDPESKVGSEFFTAMLSTLQIAALPNVSDFFPMLKRLDLQGLRKRMDRDMAKVMKTASGYVEERLREREKAGTGAEAEAEARRKDFLDVLLDYEGVTKDEPAKLSTPEINVFILEVFVAGSDTTTSTVEWALTELLRNPESMKNVKIELAKVIGSGPNKSFKESDIDNLPYLQAVIKETLRLHPPAPFLVPRKAIEDNINFIGYNVPKNTQVLVNVWAIGRDSDCWDEPFCFKPERFLGEDTSIDYKGQYFQMIPFGAGRRICPGIPLAQRLVPLVLGSLLHEFDWKLEDGVNPQAMDMREKMGIAMVKLEPLKAIPKKREM